MPHRHGYRHDIAGWYCWDCEDSTDGCAQDPFLREELILDARYMT